MVDIHLKLIFGAYQLLECYVFCCIIHILDIKSHMCILSLE